MLNQVFKTIINFFAPGKKSVFSKDQRLDMMQSGINADKPDIRMLYHRDLTSALEAKPELMQHDWWIN